MKIKSLLIGMLACTALVGCTNNDEPMNNGNENNGKKDNAYMAINIKVASDASSRAVEDGGYVAGDANENTITAANSIFLFYDAAGKWVTSGVVTGATPDDNHESTADHKGQVNDVHGAAYVVLQATQDQLQNIKQVLTVINYSGCDALKRLDKDEALAKVTSTETDPANGLNPGFLMTTSTYYDSTSGIVNTTAVTNDNIKESPEAANEAPVDIYIERAAAKVEVAANEDAYRVTPEEGNADDKNIVVDGVLTPVFITIDGWTLNGVVENTYLSKQLIEEWGTPTTAPFDSWNWAENHRSYWAKSRNWDGDQGLTYYAYEEATNEPGTTPAYCYENTVNNYSLDWNVGETGHKITTVLLKAHFHVDAEGNDDAQNYYRYSGVYYSENEYKTLILKQLQGVYAKVTTTEGSTEKADLTADDITLQIVSDGSTMAGVKFTVTLIAEGVQRVDGTTETVSATTIATFINGLSYVTTAEGFLNGACYYQVPIEHLHAALKDNVLTGVGVVRNHWYKLSIDAVRNIGEPVYNPEKDITDIPAEVDDYYLSVKLHVLSWHVVNQGVTLK